MFLSLYCPLEDLYEKHVSPTVRRRSQHQRIRFSDAEVLFLSLMQEAPFNDSKLSLH